MKTETKAMIFIEIADRRKSSSKNTQHIATLDAALIIIFIQKSLFWFEIHLTESKMF